MDTLHSDYQERQAATTTDSLSPLLIGFVVLAIKLLSISLVDKTKDVENGQLELFPLGPLSATQCFNIPGTTGAQAVPSFPGNEICVGNINFSWI